MWSHLKDNGISLPKINAKEIDQQIIPVLHEMEETGILVDASVLKKMSEEAKKKINELEEKICDLAHCQFNINSPGQLADVLFVKLKLPTADLKRTKSGYSTAASELHKLLKAHKIITFILNYRETSKLLNTYLLPLPELLDKNSRLHTTYGQDTNTGRLTSSNPNLQNIPIKGEGGAEIRKAFVASPGMVLVAADYSQIELRVVSCLANDSAMIEAFHKKVDIHTKTAAEIFNTEPEKVTADQRRAAKTVNFGVLYGMSPYGLAQSLSIDQEEAARYIHRYFEVHSGIKSYTEKVIKYAKENGYVETLFGFKRKLPNINSKFRNIAEAQKRMAINTPVQGTAAEILKLAMIELSEKIKKIDEKLRPRMLLTIHDEIVLETPEKNVKETAALVKETMENIVQICVPIKAKVEVGKNLSDLTPIL